MSESSNTNPIFNIGVTMAGAGTAGCYTGGVMDYLFEILDMWESAKKHNLSGFEEFYELVPHHDVVIDVLGGTSAGGITACLTTVYALGGKINPVKDPKLILEKRDNILYDSWVLLDDDIDSTGLTTLKKVFDSDDLKDNKFASLINSKVIDNIANNALNLTGDIVIQVENLLPYISKNLDILQVQTLLHGIPLTINFSSAVGEVKGVNDAPSHNSYEHFLVAHYKLNKGQATNKDNFLWFNPYQKEFVDRLRITTKATGAFPVGLKFREFDQNVFTDKYIQCATETTIFNRLGQKTDKKLIDWKKFPVSFTSGAVDGGTVNNEPFGEVLGILKNRYGQCIEDGYAKYGIVMIDPFPDEVDISQKYKMPEDLFDVIPQIIVTLHEQSKVKKDEMVEAVEHPYFRGEIFPRKWVNKVKDEHPITSASVGSFGGFLDIKFRHYDFFLGRDNARNYFRYYFSFEYFKHETDSSKDIIHPIHKNWTAQMRDAFKVAGKDGKTYLPIIPDMNILAEKKAGGIKSPFDYTIPDKPQYDPTQLFAMRQQMEDRFEKILDISKMKVQKQSGATKINDTSKWMEQYYHKTWWDKLKGKLIDNAFNSIFSFTKGGVARNITEMIVKLILTDLDNKNLLKKSDNDNEQQKKR